MWQKFLRLSIFLLPSSALRPIVAPFWQAEIEDTFSLTNASSSKPDHELARRDGNCPINYNSCSTLAAADAAACCISGSVCTLDHARNIACCPTGAMCTGTVNRSPTTTTDGIILGSSIATTTSGVTAVITSPATTELASYVTNPFFPFPYIPTTYSDSAACMSAYSACQSNYAACTADLEGLSGFGVTIVAPAGGVTVSPTIQNLGVSSATSICSSLSSQACYGIVSTNCAQFGTAFVVATATNPAARPTIGCFATAGMMAGLGLGIAGQIV